MTQLISAPVPFSEFFAEEPRNGIHKGPAYIGSGFKYFRMGDLFRYDRVTSGFMGGQLIDLTDKELHRHRLETGDLLFCRTSVAPQGVGKCSLVSDGGSPTVPASNLIRVRLDHRVGNPDYFYYYFQSSAGRDAVRSMTRGAAVYTITGGDIASVLVPHAPIQTQRKVAGILIMFDELIENNRRRIQILEEMAQTLFRERFVDLSLRGKLPDQSPGTNWPQLNLFDLAEVRYGFGFKSKGFHAGPSGHRVIRIRDVPKNTTTTYTDEEPGDDYEVSDGDILVGMDGEFHMCIWHDGAALLNQRVARFRPKDDAPVFWLFHALKGPISHFNSTITGTTVAHLGDRHLRTVELSVPPEPLMAQAREQLNPSERAIRNLLRQNANLRNTRDLMLPKLLSGEIDVSELDIDTSWLAA